MSSQQPTVGRIVHYRSYGTPGGEYPSVCRAAVITEVVPLKGEEAGQAEVESWDESQRCRVGLAVLNPEGMFFNRAVHQDEHNTHGGTWHWPERA